MIRRADRMDVEAILAISNEAALHTVANFAVEPEPIEDWLASFDATSRTHPWFVATDDDGVVAGFARASPWKGRCAYAFAAEISVYITPSFHRRGLGRRLYEALFASLRELGFRTAIAGITLPNPGSVALHESFGMRRAALFERIGWKFNSWHDVGYWQVQLVDDDQPPESIAPPF